MKKKIVNALLMAALVVPSVSTLTSCKDYNEDLKTEVDGEIASLRKTLQDQIDRLKQMMDSIKSCECGVKNYLSKSEAEGIYAKKSDIQSYLDQVTANKTAIKTLQDLQANMQTAITTINANLGNLGDKSVAQQISDMNNLIVTVQQVADEALKLAVEGGKCNCDFTEINSKLDELDKKIAGWDQSLTDINKTASEALAKANSNYLWVIANKKTIDSLITVWNDAEVVKRLQEIETNYMKKDEIEQLVKEAKDAATAANTLASDAMKKAEEALTAAGNAQQKADDAMTAAGNAQNKADANEIEIGKLKESLEKYVTTDEFNNKMREVEASIKKVSDKVDALENELNILKKDFSNMITGIIGQATENPVLGYINTPFGVNAMVLAAYYGSADNGMEFPARDGKFYLESSDVETWTPRNLQVMGVSSLKDVEGYLTKQNERFVTEVDGDVEGNAGTIYVTVNPSNVNFTGQQLGLETTAQNVSPITISPLQPSDRELDFGIWRNTTRGIENGFYEAKATLRAEDIDKAKFVIDFKTIGSAIKSVIKEGPQDSRTRISVAEAAGKVFSAINNTVPAYGLKASWTDETTGTTHSFFSEYNIGVTAIKPLSFAFMKDTKLKHVDGFDRMRSVVARVIREVEVARPDFNNYEFQFKSIQIGKDVTTSEDGTILTPIKISFEDNTAVITNLNSDITETITELVDAINEYYGEGCDIDQKLAEFFNEVKDTNNFQTYIDDTKSSVYAAIDKYLSRIEEHILRVINNAHRSLFITMFGNQNGKFALLSNSVNLPTKAVAGQLTLIPTTYSLQYFAPIYKKFVAVTNVYDAATKEELDLGQAQSLAAAANGGENMFKVVDGLKNCSITGEKGKIYELTYTAVDYLGVVMIKKFYVEFK